MNANLGLTARRWWRKHRQGKTSSAGDMETPTSLLHSPLSAFVAIDPSKYKRMAYGFGVLLKEQGVKGFFSSWVPTLLGYSAHGAYKFGL